MPRASMYTTLIEIALTEPPTADHRSHSRGLAEVVRCRDRLDASRSEEVGAGGVDAVLADQVAYDVALIRYARALGADCDPRSFSSPQEGRRSAERLLVSHGVQPT